MFRLFKSAIKPKITTDIHAHLISGIDDGPKTIEESINLIKGLKDLGYQTLYATPHVYQELYPNDRLDVLAGFEVLKKRVDQLQIDIDIHPAAEYFLDEHFMELLQRKEVLPIANKYLLVEDTFFERKNLIENYIFQIRVSGYQPILAHPERYLHIDKGRFRKLKEMGCLFQLNLLSLDGYYGSQVKRFAKYLLKQGYIDFLGTDLHNLQQLKLLRQFMNSSSYSRLLGTHKFKNNQIKYSVNKVF